MALNLPIADWLILAALAVVILLSRIYARSHPKIPPEQHPGLDE